MSRTVRRKNVKIDSWITDDWDYVHGRVVKVKKKGKELAKAIAKFRSDRDCTMEQYPAWFRRSLNRRLRSKQKHAVRKIIKEGKDQICIPKFVKNGLWNWW